MRWTAPPAYPEATTQSDRGTATRSSGLMTPQMNLTLPAGSQPPDCIVAAGTSAEQSRTAARNIRAFILTPPARTLYREGHQRSMRAAHLALRFEAACEPRHHVSA